MTYKQTKLLDRNRKKKKKKNQEILQQFKVKYGHYLQNATPVVKRKP